MPKASVSSTTRLGHSDVRRFRVRGRGRDGSLRARRVLRLVLGGMVAGKERLGVRLVQFSVQSDHVHLVAEATSKQALSRAMKGLAVRLARAINRALGRRGAVFSERHHERVLTTPRQVRNALAYVLCNGRKHGHAPTQSSWLDPCSSAASFDGWSRKVVGANTLASGLAEPRTWLLRVGWRRGGDRFAEDVLVRRHLPKIAGMVGRLLGDPLEAEDVVQDTFAAILGELESLRDPQAFEGWVRPACTWSLRLGSRVVSRRLGSSPRLQASRWPVRPAVL